MMTRCLVFLLLSSTAMAGDVLSGIDVLARDEFRQLAGAKVGLITNHTGIDRDGRSTIHRLNDAPNVELVRIFSPEHGIEGKFDIPVVEDAIEGTTGIPVVSLYGETRRPTAAMLAGVDTLVFDIQDIGTRFYTYVSTMGYAMQAAASHDIRFVVLDRPNPINGIDVAGPVLEDGLQSFVGFHTLPVRHGMTVGELARMFNDELGMGVDLTVVALHDWRRRYYFDETGLLWINPSPNMRSLAAALLYPGIGLLETTNLSVGRGTDTPFEIFGSPWLDGAALATYMNEIRLPGVSFSALVFTPKASKFTAETCYGVRISIGDRRMFDPLTTGFAIARYLAINYPDTWDIGAYIRLLGNSATLAALVERRSLTDIAAVYQPSLEAFVERRAAYLLYD